MAGEITSIENVEGNRILVADSITYFSMVSPDDVIVCGSHGGVTAGLFGAASGAKGLVLNDAGGGKDGAGWAALTAVEPHAVAAATVSHLSSWIGSGIDTWENGRISAANRWAREAGVRIGQSAGEASRWLAAWHPPARQPRPPSPAEHQPRVIAPGPPLAVVVDSASMIDASLVDAVVVTGSHGGVTGGRAVRAAVVGAFFNDAGIGKDRAGISRLPLMDAQGVAGGTAAHESARIGDGWDTYESGILSHVNEMANARGVSVGMTVREAVKILLQLDRGHGMPTQRVPSPRGRSERKEGREGAT